VRLRVCYHGNTVHRDERGRGLARTWTRTMTEIVDKPLVFGEALRRHRVTAGLTQEALAERARLSARAISDLERGIKHRPRHATLALLVEALQLAGAARAAFEDTAYGLGASPAIRAPVRPLQPTVAPLVGRARDLAALESHLGGVGPPVLLLVGEPGIGKSRLLREAAARAAGYGLRVLEGGCQRRGGQEPYAPFPDVLQRYIGGERPVPLRAALRGCTWLVRLLPELAEGPIPPLPPWNLTPEQERRLMVAALTHFLTNIAGPAGSLLVLDDLQWASPDGLDLLTTLLRSAAVPLRVIGAYRDTEVRPSDPLAVRLADLAAAGQAAQRVVRPLATEDAARLLDGALMGWGAAPHAGTHDDGGDAGAAVRERVVQRTGGVPFFVLSCAQALCLDDNAGVEADAVVPWDVGQSIRQRLAALPLPAREVLALAAVVGRVVPRATLIELATRSEDEVLAAFDATCQARLLEEAGEDAYRFSHDVIREVIEADLGAARRAALHRRVAEALERAPGEPAVELLAYHYARSGEQDVAIRYLEQAGDRAGERCANAAAEDYYRDVVARLDAVGRVRDAAIVREKLSKILSRVARFAAALDVLERAVETYEAIGDLDRLGQVTARIETIYVALGRAEHGRERLQRLALLLEASGASHGLADVYSALMTVFLVGGQFAEQLTLADRAARWARVAQDDRLLAHIEDQRVIGLIRSGQVEEGRRRLEDALRVATASGDGALLARIGTGASPVYYAAGDFERARVCLDRALEVAERQGDVWSVVMALNNRSELAFFTGDWRQGRLDAARSVALYRETGETGFAYALTALGRLCLGAGEWDEASRYLDECVSVAIGMGDIELLRLAQVLSAERDLRAARPRAAHARLASVLDRPGLEEWDVTMWMLPVLARTYLQMGDTTEAGAVVTHTKRRAQAMDIRVVVPEILRVEALLTLRQGRYEQAARTLAEGLAVVRPLGYPYAEAQLLQVCGHMHVEKKEWAEARGRLEAAYALFVHLGARKDAEHTAQVLASLP